MPYRLYSSSGPVASGAILQSLLWDVSAKVLSVMAQLVEGSDAEIGVGVSGPMSNLTPNPEGQPHFHPNDTSGAHDVIVFAAPFNPPQPSPWLRTAQLGLNGARITWDFRGEELRVEPTFALSIWNVASGAGVAVYTEVEVCA